MSDGFVSLDVYNRTCDRHYYKVGFSWRYHFFFCWQFCAKTASEIVMKGEELRTASENRFSQAVELYSPPAKIVYFH